MDNFSKKPASSYSIQGKKKPKKTKKQENKQTNQLNQNEAEVDYLINFPIQILI